MNMRKDVEGLTIQSDSVGFVVLEDGPTQPHGYTSERVAREQMAALAHKNPGRVFTVCRTVCSTCVGETRIEYADDCGDD